MVVEVLQTVQQHRAVDLEEDVLPDLDRVVRPDAQEICIEGCVVKFAQGEAVGHNGSASRVPVGKDVGGI
jgi:hypothetical protein